MKRHCVKQLWDAQLPYMLHLQLYGAQNFFDKFSPPIGVRGSAFKRDSKGGRTIECVDGRRHCGCRQAGGGLFLDDAQFGALVQERAITTVATHAECGAAKKAFGNSVNAEEAIREWGAERAKRFCLHHVHRTAEQMHLVTIDDEQYVCPSNFHPETVIYVDGTPKGLFRRTKNLPIGFGIDWIASPKPMHELSLCMEITLENGFGRLFSRETPMHVIGIADDKAVLEKMISSIQRTIHLLPSVRDTQKFTASAVLVNTSQRAA